MTKTVFGSHANLAHVWAQQNPDTPHGRSGDGRMSFDGATIYSYGTHFPIARFVERKGKSCVLFTTQRYSVSTGKHMSLTSRALPDSAAVYYVDDVRTDPTTKDIENAQKTLNESAAAFARCTPHDVDDALRGFTNSAGRVNDMAAFFGIRKRVKVPTIPAAVIQHVRDRCIKRDARRAERAEKQRVQYKAQEARTKNEYLNGGLHYYYTQRKWGLGASFSEQEHLCHSIEYNAIQADKVAAWRAGKPVDRMDDESVTMLRVKGDNIETSRGAVFPADHGIKAFSFIAECRHNSRGWSRNGHSIKLGTFQIDSIEPDGTVHAGCHVVSWPEIERAAKELELIA